MDGQLAVAVEYDTPTSGSPELAPAIWLYRPRPVSSITNISSQGPLEMEEGLQSLLGIGECMSFRCLCTCRVLQLSTTTEHCLASPM